MYPLRILTILFTVLLLAGKPAIAQDSHYLFSGYTYAGFESIDGDHSFVTGSFAPVFLYSHGDRLLFETELKVGYGHGGLSWNLDYANLGYILNDYLTVRTGKFLSRYNTYNDRFHPSWINKMPTDPLGLGHGDFIGLSYQFGVELSGGASLGGPKINYALFVSNGIIMEVDEHTSSVNVTHHTNFENRNNNYAVGGRLGFLPLHNSSLEIGIASYYDDKIGETGTPYKDISSFNWALDLNYLRQNISWLSGKVDLRAQMTNMSIDRFYIPLDHGEQEIDLDQRAYYGQLAYRPTRSNSSLFRNLELVLRYSVHDMPAAQFGGDDHDDEVINGNDDQVHSISTTEAITNKISLNNTLQSALLNNDTNPDNDNNDVKTQWGFGINYWISWRTKVKFSYQIEEINGRSTDAFFIQFATGL